MRTRIRVYLCVPSWPEQHPPLYFQLSRTVAPQLAHDDVGTGGSYPCCHLLFLAELIDDGWTTSVSERASAQAGRLTPAQFLLSDDGPQLLQYHCCSLPQHSR